MASWWDNLVIGAQALVNPQKAVRAAVRSNINQRAATIAGRQAAQQATGGAVGGNGGFSMNPQPTYEEMWPYAQELMRLFGWDADTAMAAASGGRGGGGGGGYGGGGGGFIDTAARDAAVSNVASTYANAEAGLKASEDAYRKISADERAAGEAATAAANTGAQQSYDTAVAKRALERKALGIEDAAGVGIDSVATEKKIADDNAARADTRMAARTQGHLDNNIKFNTDLRAVVNLEGKERQKDIADYYAGQLAQIAARRGGGGGGGGSRGGGGSSRSSRSRGLTPGQQLGFLNNLMNDAAMRNHQRYSSEYNQLAFSNTQKQFPDASLGNQLSASKYLYTQLPKKWV